MVLEMVMSEETFADRNAAQQDWTEGEIHQRPLVDAKKPSTVAGWEKVRSKEELECTYLRDMMHGIEAKKRYFTLFIITGMFEKNYRDGPLAGKLNPHYKHQHELLLTSAEDLVRELRDM